MGSKICARSGEDFSTAFAARTLSRPEERVEVGRRLSGQLAGVNMTQIGQGRDHLGDVRGLVAFAAVWHRGEKRAVRLGQQPVERNGANRLPKVARLRERNDAGQ